MLKTVRAFENCVYKEGVRIFFVSESVLKEVRKPEFLTKTGKNANKTTPAQFRPNNKVAKTVQCLFKRLLYQEKAFLGVYKKTREKQGNCTKIQLLKSYQNVGFVSKVCLKSPFLSKSKFFFIVSFCKHKVYELPFKVCQRLP